MLTLGSYRHDLRGAVLLGVCLVWVLVVAPVRAATLFDALGGTATVHKIADGAIDLALKDARISAAFDDVNIPRLKKLLFQQFCQITGGGCVYTGRSMKAAHAPLHLRDSDFAALTEDVEQAMDDQGIPYATQSRFLALLAPMEHDVVAH
jgi:hemoglobin